MEGGVGGEHLVSPGGRRVFLELFERQKIAHRSICRVQYRILNPIFLQ